MDMDRALLGSLEKLDIPKLTPKWIEEALSAHKKEADQKATITLAMFRKLVNDPNIHAEFNFDGSVTIDNYKFTHTDNYLRRVGFCLKCLTSTAISSPITSMSELGKCLNPKLYTTYLDYHKLYTCDKCTTEHRFLSGNETI